MYMLNRSKFYNAIYDFLLESMTHEKADNQANIMVDNIFETVSNIEEAIKDKDKNISPTFLSKKFHTLKSLLLYGDFYYESDLCQDIEIELRKSKKISNITSMFEELLNSLKMK